MNIHDAAHRLLTSLRPGVEHDDASIKDSGLIKLVKQTLDDLHQRTKDETIDCDYVARLETANTQVAFLAGIGLYTEQFAADFAKAVADNKSAAMKMTREARQTKLEIKEEPYLYLVALEDLPADQVMASARADKVKDSEDGTLTPMTFVEKPTGTLIEGVDTHSGAYEGLTTMGRWVTANDQFGALLSADFHQAFWRFLTGTWENQALISAGASLWMVGADFMHPYLQSALIGASGLMFARAIRGVANDNNRNGANNAGAYLGGLVGTAGITTIFHTTRAIRIALTPRTWLQTITDIPRLPWLQEFWAALFDRHPYAARLALAGERVFTQDATLMQLLGTVIDKRHGMMYAISAMFVVYYSAGFYTHKYVPSRQQNYLRINNLDFFKDRIRMVKACITVMRRNVAKWPREDPNANGNVRRRNRNAKDRFERLIKNLELEAKAIQKERGDVNDAAGSHDGREDACETVDDLVVRLEQLQEDIDGLADDIVQMLAQTFRVRNTEECEPFPTNSVVDDVFAKLQL